MKTLEALVNPFGKLESDNPDNFEKPIVGKDKIIELVLRRHDELVGTPDLVMMPVAILSPIQIDVVLQRLIQEGRLHDDSSLYLNRLISESYKKSKNPEFILHTGDIAPHNLCSSLRGKPDNPITVNIKGNVGLFFAAYSKFCTYVIEGYAEAFLAAKAENCTFVLEKTPHLGYCIGWGRCTFKTHSEEVYKEMEELFKAYDRSTDNLILLK